MGITIRKLLDVYFEKWQIQNALDAINEQVSGNKDELIDRVIEEWEQHGKNKYDLLNFIERPILARICEAYGLASKGNKQNLIKRIKKSHLLDSDFVKPTINPTTIESGNKIIGRKSKRVFGYNISDRGLTIIIACGTVGILIASTTSLWLPVLQCGVEDQGLTYKNCPLYFQISRPSLDWSFVKNMTYASNALGLIAPSSLLGGVIVQSPENNAVSLFVLDGKDPQFSDLNQFAIIQAERFKEKAQVNKYRILPSLDKNSVLIETDGNFTDQVQFSFKEKIERHESNVYILTTGFVSIQPLSKQELDGLEKTYESFGYLK